jgi:TRAP-type C4-dicarboxylate transport system substrate-binding protein
MEPTVLYSNDIFNKHRLFFNPITRMTMIKVIQKTQYLVARVLAVCLLMTQFNQTIAQNAPAQKLRVVGGVAGLNQYVRHEEPFWNKELSKLSAGKYSAEIVPFDKAGIPSGDMLRLIQLGAVPMGTALMSSTLSAQYAEFGAPDLAGLNPDMATLKRNVAAFRPYLKKAIRERHGAEVLALYVYPAQVLFCKSNFSGLQDLTKRRVRVSGVTQSDFVASLGAIPVLTGFSQILPSMASGNIDCAITAAMSGNKLGLHEVTAYQHTMPITWGLAVFAINSATWAAMPADLKVILNRELPKLEQTIWAESEAETTEGTACNTGTGRCISGKKGSMTEVTVTSADERKRREILTSVLKSWQQRCGEKCIDSWNQTIGKIPGAVTLVGK